MGSVNDNLMADMEDSLSFELLLEKISSRFINLPLKQIDLTIKNAQKNICDYFNIERSILWLFNEDEPGKILRSHWYDPKGTLPHNNQVGSEKSFPWIFKQMRQKKTAILESLNDLPQEGSKDRAGLKALGVKSIMMIPLSIDDTVVGGLSFCCFQKKNVWQESVKRRLPLFADIFANAIARKEKEKEILVHHGFESLIVDISSRFVTLTAHKVDRRIEAAQKSICEFLGIDMSALWQWSDETPHFLTVTHLHAPPEGPLRPEGIDAKKAFPWVLKQILRGEQVILNTETMPPEASQDKDSRRFFGVKSSVVIPLCSEEDTIIGILTFDDLKKERSWSKSVLKQLNMVAHLFANTIARKCMELKLQENEKRLRMATRAAGVGLWVIDIASNYVWVTRDTREIFHFDPDTRLNYDSFFEKILPADRKKVKQTIKSAIQSGKTFKQEYRILLSDKRIRWISSTGKVSCDKNGKPNRLMGALIDLSDRKKMEIKLTNQLEEIKKLKQALETENIDLKKKIEVNYIHEEIIGRSHGMQQVLSQVEQVAQTDATVLIEGETGTGKELIAKAVHRLSSRRERPLVTLNCASLPPTLVESELFGREKGAYTGALTRMSGRFELADKATLFLDEVGELPLEIQAKLLRVIELGSFERLGSTKTVQVDVRIIAATNKNLEKQVAVGNFRNDLYFRLNIFPIFLPPLRERVEDIPPLAWAFVREYEKKMAKRIDHIPSKCMEDLQLYNWPGNIRELRNLIERSLIVSKGRTLMVKPPFKSNTDAEEILSLEKIERKHILSILQRTGWRISGKGSAAEILCLKRTTLQSKMKKLGIQRP